ncbi:MAG: putative Undecaprenyl phosphate-alpha-4-amino-4-deoxy-L-arabinose arabinosyl transferase [Chlamydiia bacterium]|nr:putative Undecaprenyl phosphate-alpha-4-amino-4-deoxy-L-arabinose arabinosyl transferase [Chlamydiia bacterium]
MLEAMNQRFPYLLRLIFWVLVIKAAIVYAVQVAGIGLMPDEAQYWTWSKVLSYGYYSKPPGIAYEIAFGTLFFGDTEFGVRFGALILSFVLSLSIYFLVRQGGLQGRYAFWSALVFSLTPLGVVSSFLATTDCGFLVFWTLAAGVFVKALLEDREHSFITIGVLIGLGALFKWPVYALWIPIIAFTLWQRKMNLRFFVGLLISCLALLPSLLWNISHDFATFQHVCKSVVPTTGEKVSSSALEFFGAQFALVSPLIFLLMLVAFVGLGKQLRKLPLSIAFYWWTTFGFFVAVLTLACCKKVQGNWAVACYPTAFAMLFSYAAMKTESFMRWIKVGTLISIGLLLIVFFGTDRLSYRLNPWKEGIGWQRLEKGLKQSGYDSTKHFLFGNRYQMASLLSFYSEHQKRAYFLNLSGIRKNQFSYWPQMSEEQVGNTGFYVTIVEGHNAFQKALEKQAEMKKELGSYFSDVGAPLMLIPLYEANGEVVKVAVVLRVEGYNGKMPPATLKY